MKTLLLAGVTALALTVGVSTAHAGTPGGCYGGYCPPPPPPPPSNIVEPGTLALLGAGLIGLGMVRRKRT